MKAVPIASCLLLLATSACGRDCGGGSPLTDACRKAEDLAALVGVQLGEASTSGNAIIGQGGALHRQGKMAFSLRASGISRSSPRFDGVTARADSVAAGSQFSVDNGTSVAISADAAVGAFGGVKVRGTRVGGLDLLAGVTAATSRDGGDLHIRGRPLSLAYGFRLGLLEESRRLPGISFSAMARSLPTLSVVAPPLPAERGGSVTISLRALAITTLGWRLAASKEWGRFGVSGGIGRDSFHSTLDYDVTPGDTLLASGYEDTSFTVPKRTAFVGASFALGRATLGAEVGSVYGGHMPRMVNTFGTGRVNAARTYASLGVRFAGGRTRDPD